MRPYNMIKDRSVASGDGCFLLGRSIDDVAHQQATFVGRRGMIDVAHRQATYVRRRGTSEFKLSPKYITRGVCMYNQNSDSRSRPLIHFNALVDASVRDRCSDVCVSRHLI